MYISLNIKSRIFQSGCILDTIHLLVDLNFVFANFVEFFNFRCLLVIYYLLSFIRAPLKIHMKLWFQFTIQVITSSYAFFLAVLDPIM